MRSYMNIPSLKHSLLKKKVITMLFNYNFLTLLCQTDKNLNIMSNFFFPVNGIFPLLKNSILNVDSINFVKFNLSQFLFSLHVRAEIYTSSFTFKGIIKVIVTSSVMTYSMKFCLLCLCWNFCVPTLSIYCKAFVWYIFIT